MKKLRLESVWNILWVKLHIFRGDFYIWVRQLGSPNCTETSIWNWEDWNMSDSLWSSDVILQCSLVIRGKKSAAYQKKPHLKELCFCRTPRPSAAYPGSPSWTYRGFLSCTPRSASPRRELPPASGVKRRKRQGKKTKRKEAGRHFSFNWFI